MHPVIPTQVTKVDNNRHELQPDLLAVEEPLEIRLGYGPANKREQYNLAVTMRTPGHDFELTLGYLFTEGIISSFAQVETIHYCENIRQEEKENIVRVELKSDVEVGLKRLQRNFYVTSSCGVCGKTSIESLKTMCANKNGNKIQISASMIHGLPGKLRNHQSVFEHTGGLHAVALCNEQGEIILVREDVGRHNAFDKVIGAALVKKDFRLSDTLAMISGRASFELVQKTVMAGIPIVVAVGAPSSLAKQLAQEYGVTLLGFVRDGRFNIYCGEERVKFGNIRAGRLYT